MISFIKNFFTDLKLKSLKSKIDAKYKESVNYQRNGKLREYAQSLEEAKVLEDEYFKISKET